MLEGIVTDSDGISWVQRVCPDGSKRITFLGRLETAALEDFADKVGLPYFGKHTAIIVGDGGFQSLRRTDAAHTGTDAG
jgi:hypothetical protein